ncbi:UvrD-like helicase carboxy-terminal domain protein [Ceratobasidium sp. AG-Ba]|nr:UvrD-like helicase carboxy-terminal domain protein [Ceratobasidium sp. AG-Ba]
MTTGHLQNLNDAQHKAVTHDPTSALQILAGPGSGKTRVLTCRVANLIITHSLAASSICAVTFTNKAATEMRVRLNRLVGAAETAKLVIGTFHAICAKYVPLFKNGINKFIDTQVSYDDTETPSACLRIFRSAMQMKGTHLWRVCLEFQTHSRFSKKTINIILQKHTPELEAASISLKEPVVRALISKAKATGQTPQEMLRAASSISTQDKIQAAVAHIYEEYDATLRAANALDFDDLLVMGLQVLKAAPRAIANLRHVVVDEFAFVSQDTNTMQYELMKVLARACGGCVSVVGDPDQSIYGWRSADVTNLGRMRKDFPDTHCIHLEENYRSTGSIVSTSLAIVSQDKQRPQKSLFTSHASGPKPLLREFQNAAEEAGFIAREIRRVVASSGGMVGYGDCAVLLRFSALSRAIEAALQQESVPSRVLGGHKFFERAEVKDVLVYLQLADNPAFTPAFTRVVNVPKRGVGEKSVAEIIARATAEKTSALDVIERICDGTAPDIKPPVRRKVAELVRLIKELRKWAAEGVHAADLIRRTVDEIGYESYLQRTQPDWEARWENVQELINFAAGVGGMDDSQAEVDSEADEDWDEGGYPSDNEEHKVQTRPVVVRASSSGSVVDKIKDNDKKKAPSPSATSVLKQGTLSNWRSGSVPKPSPPVKPEPQLTPPTFGDDVLDLTGSDDDGAPIPAPSAQSVKIAPRKRANLQTPLRTFLQASLLSTDTETKEDDATGKVTITTCHAAKGLEWPVVVVPAVEGGTYPFYRAEDVDEERLVPDDIRLVDLTLMICVDPDDYSMSHEVGDLSPQTFNASSMTFHAGETRKTELSQFVSCIVQQDMALFQRNLPPITKDELELFGKLLTRPVPTNERVQKSLKEFRRVQRLRDHELDAPEDSDEAPVPAWKYTRGDSPGANWSGGGSTPTTHEGFTSLSLASVAAFGSRKTSVQKRLLPSSVAASSKSSHLNNNIKGNSATGVPIITAPSITRHPAKVNTIQPRPLSAAAASTSTTMKASSAPPKPASSAFRPPTFITPGAGTTPNSASVAGVKRRLGMGHLAAGSLSIQKARRVDREDKAAGV